MNIEDYSEKEKEEVIKAFKVFIKKVVKHSAIDFVRRVKCAKYKEIVYSDLVDYKMSLSNFDDGIFFIEQNAEKIENNLTNNKLRNAVSTLTRREKEVLRLYSENYSVKEISKIMGITEQAIKNLKARAKRKIIKKIKEW